MAAKRNKRNRRVLVVGAGIAGATVGDRLARAGVEVHLVEREPRIGGRVAEMGCKAADVCTRCHVCVASETLRGLPSLKGLHLHTQAELAALSPAARGGRRFAATLTEQGQKKTLDVDAVVLATGYQPYDPAENRAYGYRVAQNVITGTEAERQLARAHAITRPSDGAQPKRVAFVQCVGSRTEEVFRRPDDTEYCSAVCCAYALRMARRMKHQLPDADITIFYMDIQNFGKGFDQFFGDCKAKMRFVRSRPHEIGEGPNGSVRVRYALEGEPAAGAKRNCEEDFELLVLSVGIRPSPESAALADRLGVAVDADGFLGLKGASEFPVLQRDGIFVAGACEAPKDIAGCIAQAEAVSAAVLGEV